MTAAFLLTYSGLTSLCLAMDRHYRQVWQRSLPRNIATRLRVAGWLLLTVSLLLRVNGPPSWSIGLVAWFGELTAAALVLVLVMAYRSRVAGTAAIAAFCLAAILLAGTALFSF